MCKFGDISFFSFTHVAVEFGCMSITKTCKKTKVFQNKIMIYFFFSSPEPKAHG